MYMAKLTALSGDRVSGDSHEAHGHGDHPADSHGPSAAPGHDDHAQPQKPAHAPWRVRRSYDDAPLPPLKESDYLSLDPNVQLALSDRIDLYYNNPLEIFPFDAQMRKPDRFHVMFARQIEERFPDDADTRLRIVKYGRTIFSSLMTYMIGKRLFQLATIAALAFMVFGGQALFARLSPNPDVRLAATIAAMVGQSLIYAGVMTIVFTQYRTALENRSYELSREIVQRTRELQNLFTTVKAMPDQAETQFQMDGPAWGRRSALLMRLLMWVAARLEYLEKFTQVEMWRVGRERYWMNWGGGILSVLCTVGGIAPLALAHPPAGDPSTFRLLQGVAIGLSVIVSWASYFRWQTPVNLVRDKFGSESWIRYATLNVDDVVGDQSRRDKERLVEYRSLTRGR
jgi:hypothetical protein